MDFNHSESYYHPLSNIARVFRWLRSSTLSALILVLLAVHLVASPAVHSQSIRDEILRLFKRCVHLHREGVDVAPVVATLRKALEAFDQGQYRKASMLVQNASAELNRLEREAPRIVMEKRVRFSITIASLIAIPIVFYFLFPYVYLWIWLRVRRKWVVER